MRIRIKKAPPAPLMDGYDLAEFQFGHVYNVKARLGRYLIVAGYGEAATAERANDSPPDRKKGPPEGEEPST